MTTPAVRPNAAEVDRFRARGAGPRLIRLHLVSRQVPLALAILAGCGVVFQLGLRLDWVQGDGPLAQQMPVMVEAAAAAVIAASTRSPFGESELAHGRLLPYLRLGAVLGLTLAAVGLLAAGTAGGRLPDGTWAQARNVIGMTGLGLVSATLFGGALAWIGPIAYAAVTEFALTAAWKSPWIWPARPPHDLGAELCALLVLALGLVLIAVRGPLITARE
ncbi:hypothetical protein ACFYNO_24675 [Kitasatospora sp. NPDC006697]|uniref:hypothetical protein n=1 Tax=Kitasatospora sp. NPDC006697 TaxID=3364020 RepID=UPI0036C7EB67